MNPPVRKFRVMEVWYEYENGNVLVCYSSFDMGEKYKIYRRHGNSFQFLYSFDNIISATNCATKMTGQLFPDERVETA